MSTVHSSKSISKTFEPAPNHRRVQRWVPKKLPSKEASSRAQSAPKCSSGSNFADLQQYGPTRQPVLPCDSGPPPSAEPKLGRDSSTLRPDVPPLHHGSRDEAQLPIVCLKCLGPGHSRKACSNLVRCRSCFNYGHTSRFCLSKSRQQRR